MTSSADSSGRSRVSRLVVAGLIAIAIGAFLTYTPDNRPPPIPDAALVAMRPVTKVTGGHASSTECRECHEHNHDTWMASYHRTMTQVVTASNAMADFTEQTVTFPGQSQNFHIRMKDGLPWVSFGIPLNFFPLSNERREEYPLVLSTGSHHMQLYWLPVGNERTLALMPMVWLREERRWIPRYAAFLAPDHSFDPETARWNETCIRCHTTFGKPGTKKGRTFDSTVAEFGISCEACHGAAGDHIQWRRNLANGTPNNVPTDPIINPANLDSRESAAVCGACHSVLDGDYPVPFPTGNLAALEPFLVRREQAKARRQRSTEERPPDEELVTDPTMVNPLDEFIEGTFWPDGNVRVAGREYSGMIESGCYLNGRITCVSCHDLHQSRNDPRPAKEWADDMISYRTDGDHACVQCHTRADYTSSKHTHHETASGGSRCANCHMPHTSYGLLKAVRSHTINSPKVADALATGRPTSCNLCHLDKSLDWTARHLADWFGHPQPALDQEQKTIAHAALISLRGDAAQRALLAWHMSWPPALAASGTDWIPPYLGALLKDNYGAVRFIAERSLRSLPNIPAFEYDFLAERGDLIRVADSFTEAWETATNRVRIAGADVLIEADGRLDRARFEALRDQRDDRDIRIAE